MAQWHNGQSKPVLSGLQHRLSGTRCHVMTSSSSHRWFSVCFFKSRLKTFLFNQAFTEHRSDLPPAPLKLRPYGAIENRNTIIFFAGASSCWLIWAVKRVCLLVVFVLTEKIWCLWGQPCNTCCTMINCKRTVNTKLCQKIENTHYCKTLSICLPF